MEALNGPWGLVAAGLLTGSVVGFVARRGHFCTMAALERYWYAGDATGVRAWALAALTAMLTTQLLVAFAIIDVSSSFYLQTPLPVLGSVLGGIMFGFGMALVGTCGFGALLRMGGGNLRAFVVLTGMALAALAAQRGLTAHFRAAFIDPVSIDLSGIGGQSLGAMLSRVAGFDLTVPLVIVLGTAGLVWIFSDSRFRRDSGKIFAGTVIGLAITLGWVFTSYFSRTLFSPVQLEAGSFVAPLGDTILQVITVTGALPDYGVGVVVGVFLGAAAAALNARDLRWEACDDARELGRHLAGAFLMGTGGIFALGCTIGQGVSAVSVLAVSAPIVMVSIIFGARMGLAYLIEGTPFSFLARRPVEPAE